MLFTEVTEAVTAVCFSTYGLKLFLPTGDNYKAEIYHEISKCRMCLVSDARFFYYETNS